MQRNQIKKINKIKIIKKIFTHASTEKMKLSKPSMNINMRIRAYVYGSVHSNALARFILMLAVTFTYVM